MKFSSSWSKHSAKSLFRNRLPSLQAAKMSYTISHIFAQSERFCQARANSIESFLAMYSVQLLKLPGNGNAQRGLVVTRSVPKFLTIALYLMGKSRSDVDT